MIIILKILSAESLVGKNGSTNLNPFVRIRVGDQALRTKKKEKTTNPKWNECFTLSVPVVNSQTQLTLYVYSHDSLGLEEFLGGVVVSLEQQLLRMEKEPEWFQLQPREGKKDKVSGKILFSVSTGEGTPTPMSQSVDNLFETVDVSHSSPPLLLSPLSEREQNKRLQPDLSPEEKGTSLPLYRQLNLSLVQSQNSVASASLSPRFQLSTHSAPDLVELSPEEAAAAAATVSPRSPTISLQALASPDPSRRTRGITDSQIPRAVSPSRRSFLGRKLSAGRVGSMHSAIPLDALPIRQEHETKAKALGLPFPTFAETEESFAWTVRMNKEYGTLLLTKHAFSFCFGEETKRMVVIWTKEIKLVDLSELRKLVLVKLPNKVKYSFEVTEKSLREKMYDQMKSFWDPNRRKSARRSFMESESGYFSSRRESSESSAPPVSVSLPGNFTSRTNTAPTDLNHHSLQVTANNQYSQSAGNLYSMVPNNSVNSVNISITSPEPDLTFNYSELIGNKDPICSVIFDDVPSGALVLNDPSFGIPDAAVLGEQVATSSFPTNPRGIFVVCWADSSDFTKTIHTSDGDSEIEISKWELDPTRTFFTRTVYFLRKSRLATTRITQTQRLRPLWTQEDNTSTSGPGVSVSQLGNASTDGSATDQVGKTGSNESINPLSVTSSSVGTSNLNLSTTGIGLLSVGSASIGSSSAVSNIGSVSSISGGPIGAKAKDWLFETSNRMEGIPFADQFTVESRWLVISEDGGKRTTMKVHVFVDFRPNLSFAAKAAKSKINSVSVDGVSEFVKNYLSLLSNRIPPLPTAPLSASVITSSSGTIPTLRTSDSDKKDNVKDKIGEKPQQQGGFQFSFFLPFSLSPSTAAEVRNNVYSGLIIFNLIMLILVAHFYSSQGSLMEQLDHIQSIHSALVKERDSLIQSISLSQDSMSNLYSLVDEMKKKLTLFQQAVLLKRLNL